MVKGIAVLFGRYCYVLGEGGWAGSAFKCEVESKLRLFFQNFGCGYVKSARREIEREEMTEYAPLLIGDSAEFT